MTMPNKRTEAAEQAAIQRNAVTVPADKLAELQRKAKLVDGLVEVLKEVDEAMGYISELDIPIMLPTRVKEAIAKAKGGVMDNEFWGMEQAYYKAQRKELEDLRKENAELKANNVELAKALENIIDLAESIRLSGDAGDWCWEEGDEFTTAVQLLRKVKGE